MLIVWSGEAATEPTFMPLVLGPYHSSIFSSRHSPDVLEILCLYVRNGNLSLVSDLICSLAEGN